MVRRPPLSSVLAAGARRPLRARCAGLAGAVVACAVLAVAAPRARGYEFSVRARTIAQAYSLDAWQVSGGNLALARRRFAQTLALDIWNIGKPRRTVMPYHQQPPGGPRIYFTTYMRVVHDFGAYATGSLVVNGSPQDALDVIPELQPDVLQLDVLYGYLAVEGLAGGAVDLYAGRLLSFDALDAYAIDGGRVRVHLPWKMAIEAFGGLRVKGNSPLGTAATDLDGSSDAGCTEYVEGPVPGSGAWLPIDRMTPIQNNPFESDYSFCPQRDQLMPTFGAAIATDGIPWLDARVAYRRSESPSPGIIGPVDRYPYPDVGYYPNELGQAPTWGVNEERLLASVRGTWKLAGGRALLSPHAAVRYSVLHGLVDEASAGVHFSWGANSIEPAFYYSFPTFDGDSIFNVFWTDPYADYRITYDLAPPRSRWRGYAVAWLRDFMDTGTGAAPNASATAAGAQIGARYLLSRDSTARVDLFYQGGYGGGEGGGYASGSWRLSRSLIGRARASVIRFNEDLLSDLNGVTVGGQLGATYVITHGIAASLFGEDNINRFHSSQFRLLAVLDLAFRPEI